MNFEKETDLFLKALEPDDEVGNTVVRQRLPRFDVAEFGLSRTQAGYVVVRRQDSLKQLVTNTPRRKLLRQRRHNCDF